MPDGKQNASETPGEAVRERVEPCQDDGREFLLPGAKQDAALTAGEVGIDADNSLTMAQRRGNAGRLPRHLEPGQ